MLPALFLRVSPTTTGGVIKDTYNRLEDEDEKQHARSDMMELLTASGAKLMPGEFDNLDVSIKTYSGAIMVPLTFIGSKPSSRKNYNTGRVTSTQILRFEAKDIGLSFGGARLSSFKKVDTFHYPFEQPVVFTVKNGDDSLRGVSSISSPYAASNDISNDYHALGTASQADHTPEYLQWLRDNEEAWDDATPLEQMEMATALDVVGWHDELEYDALVESTDKIILANFSCTVRFLVPMSVRARRMNKTRESYELFVDDHDEGDDFDGDGIGVGLKDDGSYDSNGVSLDKIAAELMLYRYSEPQGKRARM